MTITGLSKCLNYNEFSSRLKTIETLLETEPPQPNIIDRISEFIESNQEIFIKEKRALIRLDSLAAKIRHLKGYEPLIGKLRGIVNQLIPSNPQEFLQILRNTISDTQARFEIAKLCAQQNGGSTSYFIQDFEIRKESDRSEVAKICAKQNGAATAHYIQNFNITDNATRYEIAKLCAKHGSGTAEYILNFQLDAPTSYQLYLDCVLVDPKSLLLKFNPFVQAPRRIPHWIDILKSEAPEVNHRKELFLEIQKYLINELPISNEREKIVLEMSSKIQEYPPHIQNPAALWLVSSLLLMLEMKPEDIEWMLGNGIWTELGLLKDPGLRVSLSAGLHALRPDQDFRKLWEGFLGSIRGTEGQRGLGLLVIPFLNFQQQGIEAEQLLEIANNISTLQKKNYSSFRNVYQIKNLLDTMDSLACSHALTQKQKQRGFEKIFFDSSPGGNVLIVDALKICKHITAAKGLLELKDAEWPDVTENLDVLFRRSLEKIIPLDHFTGDVSAKYEEIFGTCRKPSGLLTYAAGLKTLRDSKLLCCLGQYVVSVMDETFENKRYEITDNPHLAQIVKANPTLLEKWKEGIQLDVENLISGDTSEEGFDSEQWLHTKLVVDKHLGNEELPYLIAYLNTPSLEERTIIFSSLIKELKQSMKIEEKQQLRQELESTKKKNKEIGQEKKKTEASLANLKQRLDAFSASTLNDPLLVNLNLQKACLRLAKEGKIADKKILIKHLKDIDQALHQCSRLESEFSMDVKGLLETLSRQTEHNPEKKGDLQAIFTDNPIDLLLCGTDLSGSCQRVDGDPNLNKGLLGYLMDGKNRLLAIKDRDRIIARCLLELLWDGTQPVLYRERFYPDQIPAGHQQALNALAKQVAKKLSLPLTCRDGNVPYNMALQALGGPAPYEYSDGAGGIQKKGRFTVRGAKILD